MSRFYMYETIVGGRVIEDTANVPSVIYVCTKSHNEKAEAIIAKLNKLPNDASNEDVQRVIKEC